MDVALQTIPENHNKRNILFKGVNIQELDHNATSVSNGPGAFSAIRRAGPPAAASSSAPPPCALLSPATPAARKAFSVFTEIIGLMLV